MIRPLTCALSALLLCAPAVGFTETTPRPGPHDNRVRIATWTEGQVYRVVTSLTRVTSIEFGDGETIRSIIAGDTAGFQFDGVPGGQAFAIKPVLEGAATNIIVYTNRRSYYFHVVEARTTSHYVVQFRYPEPLSRATRAVAATAPNYAYAASGDGAFRPEAVWDDGRFTYFRFAPDAPMPAIFRTNGNKERLVNAVAQSDGVMRVSGKSRQWVLRIGKEVICIEDAVEAASGA